LVITVKIWETLIPVAVDPLVEVVGQIKPSVVVSGELLVFEVYRITVHRIFPLPDISCVEIVVREDDRGGHSPQEP